MMMRQIDDFLIDRFAQPAADRLGQFVSCYELAAFLLTGSFMFQAGFHVMRGGWMDYIAILATSSWLPFAIVRCHRLDRDPPKGVIPITRISMLPVRLISIPSSLALLIGAIPEALGNLWLSVAEDITWALIVPGLYFMACRKNPPMHRVAPNAIRGVA